MTCITAPENQLISLVNQYRIDNGLMPLKVSAILMESAQQWADFMAEEDYFSHTGKDGSSHQVRAERLGYNGGVGANILWGQKTPQAAFQTWVNSPPHNENMLSPYYKEIGVALMVEETWDYQDDVYATASMELGSGNTPMAGVCKGDEVPTQPEPPKPPKQPKPRPRKKPRNPNPPPAKPDRETRRLIRKILRSLGLRK